MSVRRSLYVFLGRPLFLFPCGFHVRACLVIVDDAWFPECVTNPPPSFPSHLRHSFRWCVFSHKSLLLMVLGQRIWRILLRQLFIKVCNLLMVVLVVLHVSAPYNSTDFTLELNRRIFVCNDNTGALYVLNIRICTTMFINNTTQIRQGWLRADCIFVLHLCIFNPTREDMAASSLVFSCMC